HDVGAVLGDVLQRTHPYGERRVQREDVDGWYVVELGVRDPAGGELRRGAGRRDAPADASRGEPVTEWREAGDVLAHGQHPRVPIVRLHERGVRLEVLGDVDEAAAVDAGEERHAPAA